MNLQKLSSNLNSQYEEEVRDSLSDYSDNFGDLFWRRDNNIQEIENLQGYEGKNIFRIIRLKLIKEKDKPKRIKKHIENIENIDMQIEAKIEDIRKVLDATVKITPEFLKSQMEDIAEFEEVESVRLVMNGIVVITRSLKYSGKDIGEFVIGIDLDSKSITVERKDGKIIDKCTHPHIAGTTKICWGSREADIKRWLKDARFYDVTLAILSVLQKHDSYESPFISLGDYLRGIRQ